MEPLRLKPRQPLEEEIENWDDDDFMVEPEDLSFKSPTTAGGLSRPSSRRRDSGSSHVSFRSELESLPGEERHVHIPGDDEKSTLDAITAAQKAGIPLPKNVPSSALMGGTIKRLGGRRLKKIIQEDWENDLELPDTSQGLKIKQTEHTDFPEILRQVSAGSSPTKTVKSSPAMARETRRESTQSNVSTLSAAMNSAIMNLDKFKDTEDDDDFFGDGYETIKVNKNRQQPKPVSFITPPTPQKETKITNTEDDFELDLELPSDGKLKLSTKRDIPKTPSSQGDDLDWGEGSLGTRFGGTRRDGRSNRSSAASALSPSVSSSITAESEDETFDGLVLPTGPVNFSERLQLRRKSRSPQRTISEEPLLPEKKTSTPTAEADKDKLDFLDGLDIGDGDVFDSGKLTLHRNVKLKDTCPASPARPKAAVSLTFTNKPVNQTVSTRIPRLSHERTHSTSLEPVYESGGQAPPRNRRSQSRLGHSSHSSVTSLPTPTTPSPSQVMTPITPRRQQVGLRTSTSSLRNEPTTTSAQLLKQKRSLPAIRAVNTPAKLGYRYDRPPSRTDSGRPLSGIRPKTPVERQRPMATDSPATARKSQLPFLPAGASQSQSQHISSKTLRHFRRHDSDNSIDLRPNSRAFSRATMRSPSPHRYRVAADTWERLSKPKNKKNFGDGHELDGFDDLPTSRESETKYLKQPITSGPKAALRNKLYQNVVPERNTPSPSTPTGRPPYTPHFARDTTASRIARETALAQRVPSNGPLAPLTTQRVTQLSTRNNYIPQPNPPTSTVRSKKHSKRHPQQMKPHLIANLNSGKESKMVNGMFYNPDTFRWEGNENALNLFESPTVTPISVSTTVNAPREKDISTPRPALITNISASKGVQVVGGMVFDPENMCWLKLDPPTKSKSETSDTMDGFDALDEDEDVFKDIPDLEDNTADDEGIQGRVSDIKDDWLVGEEFDVGPEFIRRQREEEDRWRKKCEKWVGRGSRDCETWRWTIRELVSQFDDLPM